MTYLPKESFCNLWPEPFDTFQPNSYAFHWTSADQFRGTYHCELPTRGATKLSRPTSIATDPIGCARALFFAEW